MEDALSSNLREARRRIGLSQAQVARELEDRGVPAFYPQTVAKLESGARELKFREGIELALLYNVVPASLLGSLAPAGDDRIEAAVMAELESRRTLREGLADSKDELASREEEFNALRKEVAELAKSVAEYTRATSTLAIGRTVEAPDA